MVNYKPHHLDGIFAALSDPTRRAVLARLSEAPELSVTALAAPFAMSLPAVLKHLDVLEVADLIRPRKSGRTVSCPLNAPPLHEAHRPLPRGGSAWTAPPLPPPPRPPRGRGGGKGGGKGEGGEGGCDNEPSTKPGAPTMSPDTQAATRSRPSLAIRRELRAPPESCFRAWTSPEALKRWFRPGTNEVVLEETDPRLDGRYRVVLLSPAGEVRGDRRAFWWV